MSNQIRGSLIIATNGRNRSEAHIDNKGNKATEQIIRGIGNRGCNIDYMESRSPCYNESDENRERNIISMQYIIKRDYVELNV